MNGDIENMIEFKDLFYSEIIVEMFYEMKVEKNNLIAEVKNKIDETRIKSAD